MVSEFFHSPDYSILILILLIFLSFFFLIRGILIFLANPERFHQRRLKKRLREIDGLESSLNVSTLLKSASLEKSSLDQIMVKFSLFNRIQIMMLQANLKWELRTFLIVAALSGLVMAGLGLAKFGGWGALAGGGLGLIIPYKILVRRRKRRLKKFETATAGCPGPPGSRTQGRPCLSYGITASGQRDGRSPGNGVFQNLHGI